MKWPLLSPVAPRIALIGFKYCQPLLLASVVNYVQLPDTHRDRNAGYGLIGATAIVYIGIAVSPQTSTRAEIDGAEHLIR
jgi:hypothetical protein